jgi:hypothetical protein
VRLPGVRGSLQNVVRNIESKNLLIRLKLAKYVAIHGSSPRE